MRSPLRILAATLLACLVFTATASPADAKCCPLRRVIVQASNGDSWVVEGSDLESDLESWDFFLVSWPVFNNPFKGDRTPAGRLGPEFLVTYVHEAADYDGEVSVRERVYPFAQPTPVAFTLIGQKQDWVESDNRSYKVEWGWRPFPAGAVPLLFDQTAGFDIETGGDSSVPRPAYLLITLGAVAVALALRTQRRVEQSSMARI